MDSLESLETDKQQLSVLIRQLCSSPAAHNKSSHTELQEVCRSSYVLRDDSMSRQQLTQHVGVDVGRDSASVSM